MAEILFGRGEILDPAHIPPTVFSRICFVYRVEPWTRDYWRDLLKMYQKYFGDDDNEETIRRTSRKIQNEMGLYGGRARLD